MLSKVIHINNPVGLHARLAATFVEQAKLFQSDVQLRKGEIYCNAKEFVKILKMSITYDTTIELFCQGVDEDLALTSLANYLEHLGEPKSMLLQQQ
jgi:phosphotransferase system HPr (HPr) family protein